MFKKVTNLLRIYNKYTGAYQRYDGDLKTCPPDSYFYFVFAIIDHIFDSRQFPHVAPRVRRNNLFKGGNPFRTLKITSDGEDLRKSCQSTLANYVGNDKHGIRLSLKEARKINENLPVLSTLVKRVTISRAKPDVLRKIYCDGKSCLLEMKETGHDSTAF